MAIRFSIGLKSLFATSRCRDCLIFDIQRLKMAATVGRIGYFNPPAILPFSSADRSNTRTAGDERRGHATRLENLSRAIDGVALCDSTEIKLNTVPIESNRVSSIIE